MVEPLLSPWPERSPGPRPVADRLCLQSILFVLCDDIAWQILPLELGFGSGQTCWCRLDRWQTAGVFDRLHRVLLTELNAALRSRPSRPRPTSTTSPRPSPWSTASHPSQATLDGPPHTFAFLACTLICWRRFKESHA
ncbi:transposase [Streptomyces sp. NPDC102282]|uniref:transposase n=1 Tax=Streptomyces sp. NPDC102282 TaxID=3366154 RepID=UPI0037FE1331